VKITAVQVSNFKRVRDVRITPDADRALVLIGGRNAQGKSSVLDALTAALGGKKSQPADPVRHGADEAEIIVQLDGGLTIRRVIEKSGESRLEVRDEMGAMKAPQTVLDKIVSGRFLDPLAFLAMPPKEQRASLMKLIPDADRIAGLNEKRERAFSKRTEVGRDLTRAEGELARLPELTVESPIDVAELTAEAKRLAEKQRAGDGLGAAHKQCQAETVQLAEKLKATNAEIDRLEAQLAEAKKRGVALAEEVGLCSAREAEAKAKLDAAAKEWAELLAHRVQVDADLARAGERNGKVYAARAQMERRAETADTVTKLTKEREDLTKVIETIDQRKAAILGAAKLPVDGLGIDDDGITLGASRSSRRALPSGCAWRSVSRWPRRPTSATSGFATLPCSTTSRSRSSNSTRRRRESASGSSESARRIPASSSSTTGRSRREPQRMSALRCDARGRPRRHRRRFRAVRSRGLPRLPLVRGRADDL
jgi:predicted nuclease with TOPRIM domain